MKKVCLLFALFAHNIVAYSQSAYYGAIYLNSIDSAFLMKAMNMEKQKDSEITNVIFYSHHEKMQLNYLNKFLKNPFAQNAGVLDYNIIQSAFDKYYLAAKIQLLYDLDITAQPKQVLGFSQQPFKSFTTASQYEINLPANTDDAHYYSAIPYRQEQTVAYINTFKETARTLGELRIFFPETFKMLKYADQTGQFPDFGATYKKMFTEDLNNIFKNFYKYVENYPVNAVPDIETSFLKQHNIAILKGDDNYFPFKISVETMDRVSNGYDPVSLINYFDNKYYDSSLLFKLKKSVGDKISIAFHGLNIIQTALRDTAAGKRNAGTWITLEQLNALHGNEKRYFIGLIYQEDEQFFNQILNINTISPENAIINAIEPYISSVSDQLTTIQEFINSNPDKGSRDSYMKFLELNYQLITNNVFITPDVKPYFANGSDLLHIYDNIHNQNSITNMYYTLKILNELQQSKQQEFSKEMHIVENYATFISDVANANNQEQLQDVLKKYIPKK